MAGGTRGEGAAGRRRRTIKSWIVYPERCRKGDGRDCHFTQIFGMSEWVRGSARTSSPRRIIADAPDLLSGTGPDGGADRLHERTERWARADQDAQA